MTSKETVVAHVNDLQDGEMKKVSVGETDVLLARIDGKYQAIGAYCTHYGAPLAEGVLSGTRVVCPWHHACFSVVTGDQEEPPGSDPQPHFEVRLSGDEVRVSVPDEADQRLPEMVEPDPQADTLFAKERATEVAQTVKGVRSVVNRILVKPISRSDVQIHNDVVTALARDPATDTYELKVEVQDGIVTVTGSVQSWQEQQLAARVVKGVKGVKAVKNETTFEYKPDRPDFEF